MGMMVSATDLLTLYIGLELNSLAAYVLAAFLRTDDRSAEAGLKYFVLGALASGILLFGMSLIYGFTGTTSFDGIRAALDGGMAHRRAVRRDLRARRPGLQDQRGAVPHVDARRLRRRADAGHRVLRHRAQGRRDRADRARRARCLRRRRRIAWRQIVIFAALASIVVGALGAIGQSNIKRLLAYSSINNVGFILIGLAAATAGGAQRDAGLSRDLRRDDRSAASSRC